jgi:hypothetical protein
MPFQRLTYTFTTPLAAPRAPAYRWATDYRPTDFRLAGFSGTRTVEHLAKNLVLLTDSFDSDPFDAQPGARTVKVKLVHLYPDRWAWTATHLSGPVQHSQFLYHLTPRGPQGSVLHFTGSQVERVPRPPSPRALERRTRELRHEDSQLWVRLSAALAKDLSSG